MSTMDARQARAINRRIQLLLVLLIVWDALAIVAELSFGSALFKIEGTRMAGLLAARGSFSGAALVPLGIYVFTFFRGPVRHRNLLWAGVVEQGATAFFAVYHLAINDIKFEAAAIAFVVSLVFLVALLLNIPRGQAVA
jgi:hypothetical protein